MYNPYSIGVLLEQSQSGTIPPSTRSELENAEALIGLAFSLRFNPATGQLTSPGPVNEDLAEHLVNDEIMRTKDMIILQEELAIAVMALDRTLKPRIEVIETIKEPFKTHSTRDVVLKAADLLEENGMNSAIGFARSHHLPRAAGYMRKNGIYVAVPDLHGVGGFDPESDQHQVRNLDEWKKHERLCIISSALLNWL